MVKVYLNVCVVFLFFILQADAVPVPNAGFESIDQTEQLRGWTSLVDSASVFFDRSVKHKGKASGRIRVGQVGQMVGMVSDKIPVKEHMAYNVRAFVNIEAGGSRRAFVRVHWFDADLKPIDWALGTSSWAVGGEGWEEVAATVAAPAGATFASVACVAEDWHEGFEAFNVWFDNVSLVELSSGLPDKIVLDAQPISDNRQTRVQIVVEDSLGAPVGDGTVVVLGSEVGKPPHWLVCKGGRANFVLNVGDAPVGGRMIWAQSGDVQTQRVLDDVLSGRIVGHIFDAETQQKKTAYVVVQDSLSQVVSRRAFAGAFEVFVPQGTWYITAQAGPTQMPPEQQQVVVVAGDSAIVDLPIRSWVDLEARGWLAGDLNVRGSVGKMHKPVSVDQTMLAARAAGLNWATFTNYWDTTLRRYRPQDLAFWHSDFYGLWGQIFETRRGDVWTMGGADFAAQDVFGAQVLMNQDRGVVGHTRLFTPQRHTSRVILDALAGPTFSCLDVMSERADDVLAQKLWFDLLNRGYRISATASSRAVLDDSLRALPGKYRTYVQVDGDVTPGRLMQAMAKGQSFISSGPLLQFSVFAAGPGSELPVGRKRRATIRAWARGDVQDYLTRVELIRNGEAVQVWDLDDQPRGHRLAVTLQDSVDCWYIAKCYGVDSSQVAFTNPIYFRSPHFSSPEPVQAMVKGEIRTAEGKPVEEAQVWVKNALGEVILKTIARAGRFQLWASPTSLIEVQTEGLKGMQKRIFDNTQLVELLDQLQDVNSPPDTLAAPETFERITKSLTNIEMLFVLNTQ